MIGRGLPPADLHERGTTDVARVVARVVIDRRIPAAIAARHCEDMPARPAMPDVADSANLKRSAGESAGPLDGALEIEAVVIPRETVLVGGSGAAATTMDAVASP